MRASSSGQAQPCPEARVWVSTSPAWFRRCSGDSALSAATVADGRRMAGRKRAVLVGINYPGTKAELKGCHNDVARMRRYLVDRFSFDDHGAAIRVLSDADPTAPLQPTGANIRRELARLVAAARPGDSLFFHYSGHGTRLLAETSQDDDTGYDECIVPSDMNLITGAEETVCVGKKPPDITSESVGIPSRDLLQLQKVPNGSLQPEEVMQRRIMLICVRIMPRPPATAAGSRHQCQRKSILVQGRMGCRDPNWLQDTGSYHVYIICLCAPCHLLQRPAERNRLINSARC